MGDTVTVALGKTLIEVETVIDELSLKRSERDPLLVTLGDGETESELDADPLGDGDGVALLERLVEPEEPRVGERAAEFDIKTVADPH